jgi:Domain of unknown function (DUF4124)
MSEHCAQADRSEAIDTFAPLSTYLSAAMNSRKRFGISGFSATVVGTLVLIGSQPASAQMYRCVSADGSLTFSDHGCEPQKSNPTPPPPNSGAPAGEVRTHTAVSAREKSAAHILDVMRIAPVEPEEIQLRRTVDDAAPDLVKSIDPANRLWNPANGRWRSVSDFVKADLRRDVRDSLQSTTMQMSQHSAGLYASRASDADRAALTAFLESTEGVRYVAFQAAVRPMLYSTLSAIQAQEPIMQTEPTDQVLEERRQLLRLALEYRIARSAPGTSASELNPGSDTVLENAIRREGATIDTMLSEYGASLQSIRVFTDSELARRFFADVAPALRYQLATSSTITTDFAEQEFDRYLSRWRGFYGPMRTTQSETVIVRGRTIIVTKTTTSRIFPGVQSPEAMAIQCEQREGGLYQATHRSADYNASAAGLKAIQNNCRAEQRLPPL